MTLLFGAANDLVQDLVGGVTLAAIGAGGLALRMILNRLKDVASEQQTNGGSSMRDSIEDIRSKVGQLKIDLSHMEATFRGQLELDTGGYYMTDARGKCLWTSSVWCALTGVRAEDARGDGWIMAIHEDDRQRVYEAWSMAVRTHSPFNARFKTAKTVSVQGRAVELRDSGGSLVGVLGVISVCPLQPNDETYIP